MNGSRDKPATYRHMFSEGTGREQNLQPPDPSPPVSLLRYDHILKWELFQLADLDTYQGMLKLLFMKELEHIVKSYEAYRQALLSEVEARKQRQQWYAQQPNKNFMGNM